jgi:hypothetical protein
MKRVILLLSLAICFVGCKKTESPIDSYGDGKLPETEVSNLSLPAVAPLAAIPPDFTIALLPDIQFLTDPGDEGGLEAMLTADIKWIMDNRATENIVFVGGLGDISDSGDQSWSDPQWTRVQNNFYGNKSGYAKGLETALPGFPYGIPYGLVTGNHDQRITGGIEGPNQPCAKYNAKLGRAHFNNASHPYYGGSYTTANNNNNYQRFSVGTGANQMDFIVINVNYDEDYTAPAVTDWVHSIACLNPNSKVIVLTHWIAEPGIPSNFSVQGLALWKRLRGLENVFMMAGGHHTGEGYRADTYGGYTIRTFMTDYQGWSNGGNGYFRLMKFSAANNLITIKSYSAYQNNYLDASTSNFTTPWLDTAPPATPIANGKYKIKSSLSAKVLTIEGASTANSAKLILGDYAAATPTHDEWNVTKIVASPGYYRITNVNSGLDMSIPANSLVSGTQLTQWPYGGQRNIEWKITDAGGGLYTISARSSGKFVNVKGASTTSGAQIIQWEYDNTAGNASEFQFTIVP